MQPVTARKAAAGIAVVAAGLAVAGLVVLLRGHHGPIAAVPPTAATVIASAPAAPADAPVVVADAPRPSAPLAAVSPAPAAKAAPKIAGLAFMENAARDVCACKDEACADAVQARYVAALDDHTPVDPRDMKDYLASTRALRACVRALRHE
jgi:hypothetical protein